MDHVAKTDGVLLSQLRGLIEQARQRVIQKTNSTLTLLHRKLGERILREDLRALLLQVFSDILPTLLAKLVPSYRNEFSVGPRVRSQLQVTAPVRQEFRS